MRMRKVPAQWSSVKALRKGSCKLLSVMVRKSSAQLDREIAEALSKKRGRGRRRGAHATQQAQEDADEVLIDIARFAAPSNKYPPRVYLETSIPYDRRGGGTLIDLDAEEGEEELEDYVPGAAMEIGQVFIQLSGGEPVLYVPPLDDDTFKIAVDAILADKPMTVVKTAIASELPYSGALTRRLYVALALKQASKLIHQESRASAQDE